MRQWRNINIWVPLLNFERGPGVPHPNFEGARRISLLKFRGVPGPTFKLWAGPGVPGSSSNFYTMPNITALIYVHYPKPTLVAYNNRAEITNQSENSNMDSC